MADHQATTEWLQRHEAELIAIRRDIHRHPETCFEEVRTAELVAGKLADWGIPITRGLATTGVVGTIRGSRPGQRAIALRADMDALNLQERTGLPYRSVHPGKMHACGHDGHTAMLLGAARYLAEFPDFAGTVHVIFQPAEEGGGGGRVMVEEGLFERFPCDAVYALHNKPGIPTGQFATRPGPMLAATDTFIVTFSGTGGHGGSGPHLATDPTMSLGHFILGAQSIVGRNVPAVETAVLSIGHIAAGAFDSPNVIPSIVTVRGRTSCYVPEVRALLERRLGEVAQASAALYGCTAELRFERGYPPTVNAPEETRIAIDAAADLVGASAVNGNIPPLTAGEDFAYMLERKPGANMMIGNGVGPDGRFNNLHTPLYDFNDEILLLGCRYWISLVQRELGPG